jgi:uncharacterized protein YigA (DUF484 family)
MSQTKNADGIPVLTALTDDQVADYLRRRPDFFEDKPHLLAEMSLPHQVTGKTVSLVERQVSILRERNMDMRHRLNQLLDNARTNDILFEKTKRLMLNLLDTDQLDDCLDALFFSFQNEFEIHYSRLILINSPSHEFPRPANQQAIIMDRLSVEENLSSITRNHRAICGQLDQQEKQFIFQNQANDIGSTAITCLIHDTKLIGLLAIANRDPQHYRSSMNTLFLNFVANVLSRMMVAYALTEQPMSAQSKV